MQYENKNCIRSTFHAFLGLMSCVVFRKLGPRTPGNNLQCFLMAGLISNIPIIATLSIDISELALYVSRGITPKIEMQIK